MVRNGVRASTILRISFTKSHNFLLDDITSLCEIRSTIYYIIGVFSGYLFYAVFRILQNLKLQNILKIFTKCGGYRNYRLYFET